MSNQNNAKKIIGLSLSLIAIFSIGTFSIHNNIGHINDKFSDLTTSSEKIELAVQKSIDSETILSGYTIQREVASDEVISRAARARKMANYGTIDQIKISKDMDLTQSCNISREDFITLISGVKADTSGFFEENAGLIYDLCEEYEINEIFFCGLISAESGWNIASNHRKTHNYISLMSNGGLIKFNSVEEGLRKAATTLSTNYLSENGRFYFGKTLEAVRTRFCPVNPNWSNLVYSRMQQII